jgi:hypothetical protein
MGIFDHEPPVLTASTRNYGEELMAAHAANNPGFTGPEVPQSGNRYSLPDADGRIVVWNGATTLAAELDNPYALQQWQLRQTVWGMGQRPDLVAQAAATASPDDKDILRQVVRDAQSAAAIDSGANMGKALHMAFERVDRGEPLEQLPEMFHADIKARQEALAFHGITILPEYVERVVRCLIFKVAGRLDRIGRLSDGSLVIIDDKSERDPVKYPHAKCVQLGVYANAGELFDHTRNELEPMPNVRKDFALIVHSRPGEGSCEIYRVDIARGWAAARIAVELREWRKADGLIAPYLSEANWVPADFYAPKQATEVEQYSASNGSASAVASDDASEAEEPPTVEEIAIANAIIKAVPDSSVPPSGIDPMTEADELIKRYKAKPGKQKAVWQELCRSVGITDLEHHIVGRTGLALAYVNKRNELGMTETQAEAMRASAAGSAGQESVVAEVTAIAQITEGSRAQSLTHDEVLDEIEKAQTKQDLADIWKRFTDEYGAAAWTGQIAKAGADRKLVVENQRPVASDNPFA